MQVQSYSGWTLLFVALCSPGAVAQQVGTTPVQAPNLAAPGPRRQQPQGGANVPFQGVLQGNVYWDTSTVQHNPPGNCSGFVLTLSVGTPPSGPTPTFEKFTPYRTVNNLSYLNNGSTLAVCAYAFNEVPTGQDLQVQVSVTPSAFSSAVSPVTPPMANNPNGPIKIVGGACSSVHPAVPSPSVLGSGWWTCGNYANNVNFLLQGQGANRVMGAGGSRGLLSGQPAGQPGVVSPGPIQRGMLAPGPTPMVQSPASTGGVQGNSSPTRSAKPGQKVLTNADVVKMVTGSVPESTIIRSIQSSPKNFHLGPDGCRELVQAHVSNDILNAMGDGSVRPCQETPAGIGDGGKTAGDLNPQRYPLKGKAIDPQVQLNLGPAKTGPQVNNPRASQVSAAIIGDLQKQRTATDIEATQMKLSLRPAGQAVQGGQSQLMSASGSGATAGQVAGATGSAATTDAATRPPAVTVAPPPSEKPAPSSSVNYQPPSGNPALAASQNLLLPPSGRSSTPSGETQKGTLALDGSGGGTGGSGSPGKTPASVTQLHNVNTTALTCAHDPTFRILTVSGSASPATFTPIDQYNLYTFTGCSLGDTRGTAYIYGTGSFKGNLTIKFWNDNSVLASLDESISGYPDLGNITLVVQRSDGRQAQKPGFKFYAARGDVLGNAIPLTQFPSGQVQLDPGPSLLIQLSSPVSNMKDTAAVVSRNFRIEMDRTTSNATVNGQNGFHINGGIASSYPYMPPANYRILDFFDTSHLAPSFYALRAGLVFWTPDAGSLCGAGDDLSKYYSDKPDSPAFVSRPAWSLAWEGSHLSVTGPLYSCTDLEVFKQNLVGQSQYALQVWVMGPRCLDPWTGQANLKCIADVKKELAEQ
jgi:hypothetical protein